MSKQISIKSHKGEYFVDFVQGGIEQLNEKPDNEAIYIVDKNVSEIYSSKLNNILESQRVLIIEATENNKSLDKFPRYVHQLVALNLRRGQSLIAIGGGVIQDITCFLAATMMRGVPWSFYPTTLLAQSDSCIGSKSSINSGEIKNILGTFTPPDSVVIDVDFLITLEEKDILSGIGEMLKVHAIESPESFESISSNYARLLTESEVMEDFIRNSLLIKKKIIEIDEFDVGIRNVMNYGHSFGHAIESATNFYIPHGIAVTIGMDIANFVATEIGVSDKGAFDRMHNTLRENYSLYKHVDISVSFLMDSLSKDKKNSATQLRLILPDKDGHIKVTMHDKNSALLEAINKYFTLIWQGGAR